MTDHSTPQDTSGPSETESNISHLRGMLDEEIAARDTAEWTSKQYHKDYLQQVEEGYDRHAKRTKANIDRQDNKAKRAVGNIKALEAAIAALEAQEDKLG